MIAPAKFGRTSNRRRYGETGGDRRVFTAGDFTEADGPARAARQEPAVLYGLLTAADVAELDRRRDMLRRRNRGRRFPLPMLNDG